MNSDRMTCGNHILPESSSTGVKLSCYIIRATFQNDVTSGIIGPKRGSGAMPFSGGYRGDESGRGPKARSPFCYFAGGNQRDLPDFPPGRYQQFPESIVDDAWTGKRQISPRFFRGPPTVHTYRYPFQEIPQPGAGAS